MARELVVGSADEAVQILLNRLDEIDAGDLERIALGEWAATDVHILGDYHSELNGAFLDSYARINNDILRLFALARYGSSDIRSLRQDDLDDLDFRVRVEEGTSDISDNLWKLLEKLAIELVGKMNGTEIIITVLGLGVIAGSAWGMSAFLESRKETRLEELRTAERRQALEAVQYAKCWASGSV